MDATLKWESHLCTLYGHYKMISMWRLGLKSLSLQKLRMRLQKLEFHYLKVQNNKAFKHVGIICIVNATENREWVGEF
jgi:hypothetical protein